MIVDNYLVEYNMMKSPLTANRSKKVFITNRLGKYTRVFFVSSDHERRIASDRSAPDEYSFDISSGYELSFFYRGSTLRYTTSCREWESLTWCNHRSERKEIDKNWVSNSGGKIIYNSNMVLLMKQLNTYNIFMVPVQMRRYSTGRFIAAQTHDDRTVTVNVKRVRIKHIFMSQRAEANPLNRGLWLHMCADDPHSTWFDI